ncbi:hypothetical protein [Mycobacterium sp. IDR2000157661]|uniref:hypothetical protein n=1 Tax=Mycobacterium sp. IDR2000157661 TaxID=2867005 RepID=UPI001EEB8CEA|nr:hypothetical protein [Mycobacterium sp. IDR2000157661]ULE31563.1 hypothetical protein K3G64_15200 [Mycobacterium sp. IDR2000157661]
MNAKQIKMFSATIGAGALLGMGAVAVTVGTSSAQEVEPLPPGPVTTSEITTGETVTETVAPEAPESPAATPPITTPPSTIATVTP